MSNSEITANGSILPDFNSAAAVRHRRRRGLSDLVTRYIMTLGGISAIIAIVLIAFYLLYVVLPMFKPASLDKLASYNVPGNATVETVDYFMEEQHEIGLRVTENAELNFFNTGDGSPVKTVQPLKNHSAEIIAYSAGDPSQALLAFATGAGEVLLVKHRYEVTYPDDKRKIDP
jgi:phosphate transport system permease protein